MGGCACVGLAPGAWEVVYWDTERGIFLSHAAVARRLLVLVCFYFLHSEGARLCMLSGMSNYANDPAHADPTASSTTPDTGSTSSTAHDNAARQIQGRGASADQEEEQGRRKKVTKRRKVNHACLYCRRSHMTCDEGRPCQRW